MTEQTDYFKTFCKVSKAFGKALGMEEILDLIVRSATETMDGRAACLFLADEEQDVFIPTAQTGLSDDYLHAKPMKAKRVVDDILRGGFISIRDCTTDPRVENHEAKKAEGLASILVVPVMASGKAIGVLSLYTKTPRDFEEDEVEFLSVLAEHGGIAVQRAQLFERINRNAELFFELASNINSSLDIKKIMHILTAEIADSFGMKGVSIRLINRDTGTLDLMASYGFSEEFLNKGPILADKGVGTALSGKTVVILDTATDDGVQYREATLKEGIASVLSVPIKDKDDAVIGTMNLCSGVKTDFPEDVVQLVNAVAQQGGLAIQNASMYLLLEEDKKNLEQEIWSHRSWF
ncbi:GAF domain-containing protein [Thermodesulfobacteriota bacterium]